MLWVNFSRGETAGLEAADNLFFLATDIEPDPDQPAPWEGGPRTTWVFICLIDTGQPGRRIVIAFTSMPNLFRFTKRGQASMGRQFLPPTNEAIRVSIDTLRAQVPLHDIIVDPEPEEFVSLLSTGQFDWAEDGLTSLIEG